MSNSADRVLAYIVANPGCCGMDVHRALRPSALKPAATYRDLRTLREAGLTRAVRDAQRMRLYVDLEANSTQGVHEP